VKMYWATTTYSVAQIGTTGKFSGSIVTPLQLELHNV
jgi:hypothetical protein